MIHLLAQTTQHTAWTPESVYWLVGGLAVIFAVLITPNAIAIIKASKAEAKAEANSQQLQGQQTQLTSHDAQLTELALHTAAPLKSTPATDVTGNRPVPTPERIGGAFNMAEGKDVT